MSGVFVLDRIAVLPGRLAACRDALREGYLPGARRRGMELVGSWCAPPVEVEGEPTDLFLLWRLAGIGEFFAMRGQAAADPGVAAFWRGLEGLVLGRERRVLGEVGLSE